MGILEDISGKVLTGKNKDVKTLCLKALNEGYSTEEILNKGLLEGINEASMRYRKGEILITHVLLAAGAMTTGTKVLQLQFPDIALEDDELPPEPKGKVVIGTIKGDLHDIGKNLVKLMMESSGLEVIDLGVNVEPEAFINTAIENDARIVACSVLLTTAMPMVAKVVEEAEKKGVRDQIRIMVGGAPLTHEFAESIGADAYTDNAAEAVEKALSFLNCSS